MSDNPQDQDDQSTDAFATDRSDAIPTQSVPEDFDMAEMGFEHELATRPALPPVGTQTIRVYLPKEQQPLVFENVERLVLGRGDDDRTPDVDLSLYYGSMLGVSRFHAEIAYERGVYYLKDLNSSNGTWLNMQKIQGGERLPMESSNQVRLGHLLMLISIG